MTRKTPQEWANYWRARCAVAERRNERLLESVTTYLGAWERFVRLSEFHDAFFEEHYDPGLAAALRDLKHIAAAFLEAPQETP